MYETDLSVTYTKHYVGNCEFMRHLATHQQPYIYLSELMGVFAMVTKTDESEEVQ
jgi:hypothetical protein